MTFNIKLQGKVFILGEIVIFFLIRTWKDWGFFFWELSAVSERVGNYVTAMLCFPIEYLCKQFQLFINTVAIGFISWFIF